MLLRNWEKRHCVILVTKGRLGTTSQTTKQLHSKRGKLLSNIIVRCTLNKLLQSLQRRVQVIPCICALTPQLFAGFFVVGAHLLLPFFPLTSIKSQSVVTFLDSSTSSSPKPLLSLNFLTKDSTIVSVLPLLFWIGLDFSKDWAW